MSIFKRIASTISIVVGLFFLPGCQKKKNTLETTLPRKSYDVIKMANGAVVNSHVVSLAETNNALVIAALPEAYNLQLLLNVTIPAPATTMSDLCAATPELAQALPNLAEMLPPAPLEGEKKTSPFFTTLFENKIKALQHQLSHLGQLPSREALYDCQTILALTNKKTEATTLLVQAIMNVNADGSDGDRNIPLEKLSSCYQPQTNYRWPKTSLHPNPNVADLEAQVTLWKQELLNPATTPEQKNKLEQQISQAALTLEELKHWSFLIGSADPFVVLPKFMLEKKENGLQIGDYAVVLYQGILYPAIIGDIGPASKIGEASLRLCRAIDPRSGANHRPISSPHVSYFFFPKSVEKPFKAPDYAHWSERCHELWKNLGGSMTLPWHEWNKIEKEWLKSEPPLSLPETI